MKNIRCPHCQSLCEIGSGYYHDDKLNIRCNRCHQAILATNEDDEKPLMKLYTKPAKETVDMLPAWSPGGRYNAAGNYNYGYPNNLNHEQQQSGTKANDYDGFSD